MGTAIVGDQDLFRARDFSALRKSPRRGNRDFVGYFASLNEVNQFLRRKSKSPSANRNSHHILSILP